LLWKAKISLINDIFTHLNKNKNQLVRIKIDVIFKMVLSKELVVKTFRAIFIGYSSYFFMVYASLYFKQKAVKTEHFENISTSKWCTKNPIRIFFDTVIFFFSKP